MPSRHYPVRLTAVALAILLAGCAAQTAYKDGQELIAQDKVELGLLKFRQAMQEDPHNQQYRAAYLQTRERAVRAYEQQAQIVAAEGKTGEAQALYQRALSLDPGSERARAGIAAIETARRHAHLLQEAEAAAAIGDANMAQMKLNAILAENPSHAGAAALKHHMAEQAARPVGPDNALATAFKKPISIEFRDAQLRQVFEVIAISSGLNFVFDKDVKTDQKTSIFLKNSTVEAAVYMVLLTNQLDQQVLDANTILIYPKTEAKQKDYQELVVKSFFLTNADAKTVGNTIKTIVKSRDIVIDEKLNMVIVRDTPEAIRMTEKLVALHDAAEPEVMLEVEILEVKRARLLDLGIQWPDTLTLSTVNSSLEALRAAVSDITDRKLIVSGSPVTLRAQNTNTDTNLLANPRIRTRNREKAKIVIGDKVPIISTTTQLNGNSPVLSEQITYVDVGLKLEVEPTVYLDGNVAIKVGLEVNNLGERAPSVTSVAYRIGTRTASTVLRLKDGETQVLAGLINDEDRKSAAKVPGLGEIPVVGRLFGSSRNDNDKTEILLSITPRIIRNIARPAGTQSEFRAGTETSFRIAPDSSTRISVLPAERAPAAMQALPAAVPGAAPPNPGPSGVTPKQEPMRPAAAANSGQGAMASAPTAYLVWMGPQQFKVGDPIDVQFVMESREPVAAVAMTFGFDAKALQLIGVNESEFLKQGGAKTRFTSEVDGSGKVTVKAARIGPHAASGATEPGVVAALNFRAAAPSGAARVQLLEVAAFDAAGKPIVLPALAPHVVSIHQ